MDQRKGAITQLPYQCELGAQWAIGATRCDDTCAKTVLLDTHGPCGGVRKCSGDTVKHDTNVQVKMSQQPRSASPCTGRLSLPNAIGIRVSEGRGLSRRPPCPPPSPEVWRSPSKHPLLVADIAPLSNKMHQASLSHSCAVHTHQSLLLMMRRASRSDIRCLHGFVEFLCGLVLCVPGWIRWQDGLSATEGEVACIHTRPCAASSGWHGIAWPILSTSKRSVPTNSHRSRAPQFER